MPRFQSCYAGIAPRGVNKFAEIAEVCSALVVVKTASTPGSCIPCKANPFNFVCSCKGSRKSGMCSHILLVTHVEMKCLPQRQRNPLCNLHHMIGKIAGGKKGVGGKTRGRTVKHCLLPEDSSDEEEARAPKKLKW
jgi:hypothetical protein